MYDKEVKEALGAHLDELVAAGRALKFPVRMPSRQLGKAARAQHRMQADLDARHKAVRERWPDSGTALTVLVDEEPGGRVMLFVIESSSGR